MVYTVRLAGIGRAGGRNAFEHLLPMLGLTQKNGSPAHPQTQGKVCEDLGQRCIGFDLTPAKV